MVRELSRKERTTLHLLGVGLAVLYVAWLIVTAHNLGYSRDEGFYFHAARAYQRWFDVLADNPDRAMTPEIIDRYFKTNHEHPALLKTLFGVSDRILNKKLGILSPSTALRLPGMLTAGLCVYLIFIWGAFAFDLRAGFTAALAFALMPRIFYHAHLSCFDMPITAFMLLVTYLYWRSLASWRFGMGAGVAFGFALCVKLNAFFLPFVLGGHYLAVLLHRRGRREKPAPKPWAFVFGAVFAPPIFLGHWPWLWHDTFSRLQGYLGFHSGHAFYNTAYFGENIIQAPTPVSLPTVMTLFTVPTVVVLLALFGMLLRLRRHLPAAVDGRPAPYWQPSGRKSLFGMDLLWFICLVFPLALISLPSVPIFGGTKHWMPAMPYLALFAGAGMVRLTDLAATRLWKLPKRAVQVALMLLILAPPLQQTVTSHPFGIASYVPLVGGARGAASLGMLRQFWGYTTGSVLPWLDEHVPPGGRVYFHDTQGSAIAMFKEEGTLRRDIRPERITRSDFALTHHELHMIVDEANIWNSYSTFTPVHVLTYQGVPIVSIYRREN